MSFYWRLFLTVLTRFCILSLSSSATGFDISPSNECLLRASARFCPSLHLWGAIGLLAALLTLSTFWATVHRSPLEPVYGNGKLVRFLDISRLIAPVTLLNVFRTALNFLWWRPVASALSIGFGVILNAEIQNGWNSFFSLSIWKIGFLFLFVFKFLKVVVHSISYLAYRPQLPSAKNAAA